jgi:hypothetical protein
VLLAEQESGLLDLPVEVLVVVLVRPLRAVQEHQHQQHPAPAQKEQAVKIV